MNFWPCEPPFLLAVRNPASSLHFMTPLLNLTGADYTQRIRQLIICGEVFRHLTAVFTDVLTIGGTFPSVGFWLSRVRTGFRTFLQHQLQFLSGRLFCSDFYCGDGKIGPVTHRRAPFLARLTCTVVLMKGPQLPFRLLGGGFFPFFFLSISDFLLAFPPFLELLVPVYHFEDKIRGFVRTTLQRALLSPTQKRGSYQRYLVVLRFTVPALFFR